MKEIIIFTDGSCKGPIKNKRGGCGVYFPKYTKYNISYKLKKENITNQVAELTACIKGIEKVLSKIVFYKIIIYTDSMYLINSITTWSDKWPPVLGAQLPGNWMGNPGRGPSKGDQSSGFPYHR